MMEQASLIKWKKDGLKTPLSRALGLGAGHGALHHWMIQRVTGVFAVPLTFWLAWAVLQIKGLSYDGVVAWIAQPVNAVLMMLTVVVFAYHAALGLQVVIEDYVHTAGRKIVTLLFMKAVFIFVAAVSVFSILKVAL